MTNLSTIREWANEFVDEHDDERPMGEAVLTLIEIAKAAYAVTYATGKCIDCYRHPDDHDPDCALGKITYDFPHA